MGFKAEPFDLWQYLCIGVYDPLIRCKIELEGGIDLSLLKKAVALSLETCPLIACRFSGGGLYPKWAKLNLDVEKIVEEAVSDSCFAHEIPLENEFQLKIYIAKGEASDTLYAIISHIVCDAAGFKEYLCLLSAIYSSLKNGLKPNLPPPYTRGIKPLFNSFTKEELKAIRSSKGHAYQQSSQKGVPWGVSGKAHMIARDMPIDTIKAFAKIKGATVNDLLLASFAESFLEMTNTSEITLTSTLDMRRYIKKSEKIGISNYSNNCSCHFEASSDIVDQAIAQMKLYKETNNILKSAILWDLSTKLLPWPILKNVLLKVISHPIVSFTNLAIIDDSLLSFSGATVKSAYLTASIKPSPYLQLTVSTFKGVCTLGCNIYGDDSAKAWVESLLESIAIKAHALDIRDKKILA